MIYILGSFIEQTKFKTNEHVPTGAAGGDLPDAKRVDTLPSETEEPITSKVEVRTLSIPCYADMLVMFSSPPGKY